jgi:eukaryotic-like serine/threonine-protein kinase
MSLRLGDVLDGRYEIVAKIGAGTHGIVYRAKAVELDQDVAIKVLYPNFAKSPSFTKRMQREARAMGQLAGTSAVQVLEFRKAPNGQAYLVMEFLEGVDLAQYLQDVEKDGGRMPIASMLETLEPIAATLEAGHALKIIHRDIKPENIFLLRRKARGHVRLLDFGVVKDLKASAITMPGTVPGSPAYVAPEAWRARPGGVDQRVDVYAFGVLVYRILTGRLPFDPNRPVQELIADVATRERPSICAFRPDLPALIDQWALKALAASPEHRFASMDTLWRSLVSSLRQ